MFLIARDVPSRLNKLIDEVGFRSHYSNDTKRAMQCCVRHARVFQVLKQNVAPVASVVTPVYAAIVDSVVASETATVKVSGGKNDFWGFHVDSGNFQQAAAQAEVSYDVPTKSLKQLRVRRCKFSDLWV
jgi:hypothetical protein